MNKDISFSSGDEIETSSTDVDHDSIPPQTHRKPKQSRPTNFISPGSAAAFALNRTKVSDNNAAYVHHCSSEACRNWTQPYEPLQ